QNRAPWDMPIIMITATPATKQQRLAALEAGAWDYVSVLLKPEELTLKVEAMARIKLEMERALEVSAVDLEGGLYTQSGLGWRTAVAADRDCVAPARLRAAAARARRVRRRRGRAPDAGRAREPARARGQGAASGASGERRADPGLPAVALAAPRRGLPPRVDFAFPRTTIWRPRHISPHEEDAMKYLCLIYQDEQGA